MEKVVVGVSGGPDSLCLLHVLKSLEPIYQLNLVVAHLNHKLRGIDSQADADFVQETATNWQIPLFKKEQDIAQIAKQRKQSLEETARHLRYAFLWEVATTIKARKIAVGHNSDDQVETILMHFLQGSGLAGLRGMLAQLNIATLNLNPHDTATLTAQPAPHLIRPLLNISRAEVEIYCQENKLKPRQDASNLDITFYRNRLRHKLIPHLETYNPNIRQTLQRTARVIAAETEILVEHLNQAWRQVVKNESLKKITFDLHTWQNLPLALKRSTLRRAVYHLQRNLRELGFEQLESAIDIISTGHTGTQVTLPQGIILLVSYQSLIITTTKESDHQADLDEPTLVKNQTVKLDLPNTHSIPGTAWVFTGELLTASQVNLDAIKQASRWEAYLDANVVGPEAILRTRRPGDIFYPLGMAGHSKKINEFMIDKKIPAKQRDHIPLLVSNKQILWVCGYRPDQRACLSTTSQNIFHLKFKTKL